MLKAIKRETEGCAPDIWYNTAQPPWESLGLGAGKKAPTDQIQGEQCRFHPSHGTEDQLFALAGLLKGHGCLPIRFKCFLWAWGRLLSMHPGESCRGYCGRMWNCGHCYEASNPYVTGARAVSIFTAGSQTHFRSVLSSTGVVPCHQFCLWFSWTQGKGGVECPVWGALNCVSALGRWCGSVGFVRSSAHTGTVCSWMSGSVSVRMKVLISTIWFYRLFMLYGGFQLFSCALHGLV